MAEIQLQPSPVLGTDTRIGANRIVERDDLALVSVATPLGGEEALANALRDNWSLAMPGAVLSTTSGEIRAIRTAPDQIMLAIQGADVGAAASIQTSLKGVGYTTDQTDAYFVLEISGPETLAALERLCPLDLSQLETGAAARSVMHHMGTTILRLKRDRFLLLSARSSAGSFFRSVEAAFRCCQIRTKADPA